MSHDIFPCFTLVIKEKKRKEKEILNNDLAVLPSHDTMIRNKEVTKSLKELWKQHLKFPRQERKKSGPKLLR